MKVEIDVTEEIEKVIEKEVEKQLDKGGILGFIRRVVSDHYQNSGLIPQVRSLQLSVAHLKSKVKKLEGKC